MNTAKQNSESANVTNRTINTGNNFNNNKNYNKMEKLLNKLHYNCLDFDNCGKDWICENCLKTIETIEKKQTNTFIFSDYEAFCFHRAYNPEDENINGVSKIFALTFPNYMEMNLTNKGCWDCIECDNCVNCHFCKNIDNCINCYHCTDCENCYSCESCEVCFDCNNLKSVFYHNNNRKRNTLQTA